MKLLTVNNFKTQKGENQGYLTGIMHLAPASLSGHNVCPGSSPLCREFCLNLSGQGYYPRVQKARIRKTKLYFERQAEFISILKSDIRALCRLAKRRNLKPAVRLNGTSDIAWEIKHPELFGEFPQVQFYDYTKLVGRLQRALPANYHLTFSLSEKNEPAARLALAAGYNVAAVFSAARPRTFLGVPVIDGDSSDCRFLDKKVRIVGLSPKGKARGKSNGFIR